MLLDLKKSLYWSLGSHGALLLLLLISPYLPFKPYRTHDEKITWINLPKGMGDDLGTAIRKAKDLPQSTIQEQKRPLESSPKIEKPSMTYQKKGIAKPPPQAKLPKPPKSEEELRMEQILSQAKKEVATRKAAPPEAAQIPDTAGGGIPDGSTQGPFVPPDDPERILYQQKIKKRVMEEWIPPLKFQDASLGLICKLVVRINERGELIDTEWEQKSGNEVFDLSALRAIQKAAPLDPPPERLKWEAIHEGFEFEFNPQHQP